MKFRISNVGSLRAPLGLAVTLFTTLLPLLGHAGPLQEAEVHRIIKDVRIVDPGHTPSRAAHLHDVVKGDLAVQTGVQSRAELLFQDQTLTRLGPETLFAFTPGTRDLTLDHGRMLLQVPKGLGGASIRTAAVTAAITGTTIMIENEPGSHLKFIVLEGSLRLSFGTHKSGGAVLTAGKMIVMHPTDKTFPRAVDIDLVKLVKTASLIDPVKFSGNSNVPAEPLPSLNLIETQIAVQTALKQRGSLSETNLVINGNGAVSATAATAIIPPNQALVVTGSNVGSATAASTSLDQRELATAPLVAVNSTTSGGSTAANGSLAATGGNLSNSNGKGKDSTGDPTSGKSGNPNPGPPGNLTSGKPGNPNPGIPGNPTSGTPGNPNPGKPGGPTPGVPGKPGGSAPGGPGKPGGPTPGGPGKPGGSTPGGPGKPGGSTPGGPGKPGGA